MKNLLFLGAFLVAGLSYAQQEITPEQRENTRRTQIAMEQMNEKINTQVLEISQVINLAHGELGAVREAVGTYQHGLQDVSRSTVADVQKAEKRASLKKDLNSMLKDIVGEKKASAYINKS